MVVNPPEEINMPGGDRTGPMGQGPRTGRQMGNCPGAVPVGGFGRGFGRGMGRGFGRGMGFGRGFGFRRAQVTPVYGAPAQPVYPQQPTKEEEAQMLEQETKAIEEEQKVLKEELDDIKKRLDELKKQQ